MGLEALNTTVQKTGGSINVSMHPVANRSLPPAQWGGADNALLTNIIISNPNANVLNLAITIFELVGQTQNSFASLIFGTTTVRAAFSENVTLNAGQTYVLVSDGLFRAGCTAPGGGPCLNPSQPIALIEARILWNSNGGLPPTATYKGSFYDTNGNWTQTVLLPLQSE